MKLSILTPEKIVFEGKVDSLKLPGSLGLMGVLNNHASILTGITPGALSFKSSGTEFHYFTHGGFFEFNNNTGVLLVKVAEKPEEIDIERAKESEKRAKLRLKEKKNLDVDRAQRALLRSLFRQKIGQPFN